MEFFFPNLKRSDMIEGRNFVILNNKFRLISYFIFFDISSTAARMVIKCFAWQVCPIAKDKLGQYFFKNQKGETFLFSKHNACKIWSPLCFYYPLSFSVNIYFLMYMYEFSFLNKEESYVRSFHYLFWNIS